MMFAIGYPLSATGEVSLERRWRIAESGERKAES